MAAAVLQCRVELTWLAAAAAPDHCEPCAQTHAAVSMHATAMYLFEQAQVALEQQVVQ